MQPFLAFSVSLFFLRVRVAPRLRSLRIYPPRFCGFAVFKYKPCCKVLVTSYSLGDGLRACTLNSRSSCNKQMCLNHWPLATGHWPLVTGHWLLAAGCWLLATGCWLLATGCWLLAGWRHPKLRQVSQERVKGLHPGHTTTNSWRDTRDSIQHTAADSSPQPAASSQQPAASSQ